MIILSSPGLCPLESLFLLHKPSIPRVNRQFPSISEIDQSLQQILIGLLRSSKNAFIKLSKSTFLESLDIVTNLPSPPPPSPKNYSGAVASLESDNTFIVQIERSQINITPRQNVRACVNFCISGLHVLLGSLVVFQLVVVKSAATDERKKDHKYKTGM